MDSDVFYRLLSLSMFFRIRGGGGSILTGAVRRALHVSVQKSETVHAQNEAMSWLYEIVRPVLAKATYSGFSISRP